MNNLQKSEVYKDAVRNIACLIGVSILDLIVLIALLIWNNKWLLFLFLVVTITVLVITVATHYAVKELKAYVTLNDFSDKG